MEFRPDAPRWQQVADVIRERIADGTYPAGSRVPSVLDVVAEFGIAGTTAQKAFRALRADGLIYTAGSLGSFVSPIEK